MTIREVCRHQLFAMHYIETLSAKEAAIRSGYSELSASRLMNHPTVQMHIEQLQHELKEDWKCRVNEILESLRSIVVANILDYVEQDSAGNYLLKPRSDLSKESLTAISRLSTTEDGRIISIYFKEKLPAIDAALKRLGVDGYRVDDKNLADLTIRLNQEYKEVKKLKEKLKTQIHNPKKSKFNAKQRNSSIN